MCECVFTFVCVCACVCVCVHLCICVCIWMLGGLHVASTCDLDFQQTEKMIICFACMLYVLPVDQIA